MTRLFVTAVLCTTMCGCSDGMSSPSLLSSRHTTESNAIEPTVAYGWSRPVTAGVFPQASAKLGAAEDTLDGHPLRAIVTDATVRVRGDDQPCSACHDWAKTVSRTTFCERVPAFLALPTSKGDGHDDVSAKPLVLKDLLDRWHAAGCPD